jgi:hypothetical protein
MIDDIAKELKRTGSSVDLIAEDNARQLVGAALDASLASLGGILAHVYYRTIENASDEDEGQGFFRRQPRPCRIFGGSSPF